MDNDKVQALGVCNYHNYSNMYIEPRVNSHAYNILCTTLIPRPSHVFQCNTHTHTQKKKKKKKIGHGQSYLATIPS